MPTIDLEAALEKVIQLKKEVGIARDKIAEVESRTSHMADAKRKALDFVKPNAALAAVQTALAAAEGELKEKHASLQIPPQFLDKVLRHIDNIEDQESRIRAVALHPAAHPDPNKYLKAYQETQARIKVDLITAREALRKEIIVRQIPEQHDALLHEQKTLHQQMTVPRKGDIWRFR